MSAYGQESQGYDQYNQYGAADQTQNAYGQSAYGYFLPVHHQNAYGQSAYGSEYQQAEGTGDEYQTYGQEYAAQPDGGDYTSYYGSTYGADGGEYTDQYAAPDAIPEFSSESYYQGGLSAEAPQLDLQMDSAPIPPVKDIPEQAAASDGFEAPPTNDPGVAPSNDSVNRLSTQFGSMSSATSNWASASTPPSASEGSAKKWADPMAKGKTKMAGATDTAKEAGPVDPKTIDTTSANVSDVRKMWQQAAATAPPPMPKTKHGIVLPAAEASSTVHTTGQMDRSAYARNNMTSVRTPSKVSGVSSMGSNGGDNNAPVKATTDKPNNQQNQNANRDLPAIGGSSERGEKAGSDVPATPAIPATPTPAPKPVVQASPPSVDFSVEQFNELMEQIDSGDADQKAYAAMELQTMALDSRSQVLMAQNGAIGPLVKLLQPGDPMVQASAAGALWNLAANEHNKFAIAQAGAIQPLVAMLYTDVREAQLSAAGALQNLCVNASNKKTVAAAGGVEALMMLLSDKDRHVKAKAAGALQSLAVDEDNQKKIKSLGAIPLITKLLSSRTPEVQSNAAGALHNLAVNDEEAQEAVATAGAIPPLISLMQNASPDLQAKAAATIWSIAGREENRKRIMEAGGIPPLVRMVQSNHLDCQSKASGAIRCLTMSSFTRPEFEKAGAIPHLVVLLSSGNQEVTINAAGALENLGCR
eukprot:CAMPEP_0179454856 /NCGR_PEP_ID=MMETSP0799-20121207/38817_1 /TAXON_ID=46947 /ORGANISM="Geminigera cryophila, Strain CCMP2564" /LENGTH=698 /DNA_ID=CAMNT_0021253347 /DNA_START=57 /DNA_END=2156 /DNA_ORIENTATION=+